MRSVIALGAAATVTALGLWLPTTTGGGEPGSPQLSSADDSRQLPSGGREVTSGAARLEPGHASRRDRSGGETSQRRLGPNGYAATTPAPPGATASAGPGTSTSTPVAGTSRTGTSAAGSSRTETSPAGTSAAGSPRTGTSPAGSSPTGTRSAGTSTAGAGTSAAGASPAGSLRPPADIATDCSADVTAPLTQWVNSLPDHSAVLFPQNGCYLVNGSITVTRKTGLTIDGNGSTFKATRPVPSPEENRAQWHFDYGADLTVKNMTLVGIHPTTQPYDGAYEYDHNLFIRGTKGVTVDRIAAKNAYGDNVAIAQGRDWTTIPSDITISNSVFDGAGRMGVSCVACQNVTVDRNQISNTAIFSFDLEIEGDNWPGKNVRFTNNVISGTLGGAMFSIGAPVNWSGVDVSDIYIAGNKMTTFANASFDCLPAISLGYSKSHVNGITIENNELNSISDGVLVKDASDVVVRNNVLNYRSGCGGTAGVHFVSVSGGQASGNTTSGFPTPFREDNGR
ncbi:hypothetical protein [Blastococcus sp. SYSU DS0539]